MKVEDCIFQVQRRTTGGCIDLAFAFMREFAVPLFSLTAAFAVPSCLITYWLASNYSDTLMFSWLVFAVFTAFFSGALVAGVGPQVFGVELNMGNSIRAMLKRFIGYGFVVGLVRITQWVSMLCFFWPVVIISPLIGHVAEVCYLEQSKLDNIPSRIWALSRGAGYVRNLQRMVTLLLLWVLLAVGLFFTIDFFAGFMFNTPVISGRLEMSPDYPTDLVRLLNTDARVLATAQISLWIPFPVIRLAWFFCYLDQRIRSECWDIDLQFRAEATRLETAS